jgi:hypothetical protein
MIFKNGNLFFRAKQKDIGTYTEIFEIAYKGDFKSLMIVPIRIIILP